jgi:uncharacterized membrane protein HdeD (DUF308 family)
MARTTDIEVVEVGMVDRSYFFWRGGLSILLGVIILVYPKLTVLTFVTLVSIWLLLLGVISIIEGLAGIRRGGWGWLGSLLVGILQLGVGAYLVQRPGLATLTIITLLGLVFIFQGFGYLVKTFGEPSVSGGHRVISLLLAALSFIAGVWIWRYPFHGTLAFVWLLGLYAIVSGAMLIGMGTATHEDAVA